MVFSADLGVFWLRPSITGKTKDPEPPGREGGFVLFPPQRGRVGVPCVYVKPPLPSITEVAWESSRPVSESTGVGSDRGREVLE